MYSVHAPQYLHVSVTQAGPALSKERHPGQLGKADLSPETIRDREVRMRKGHRGHRQVRGNVCPRWRGSWPCGDMTSVLASTLAAMTVANKTQPRKGRDSVGSQFKGYREEGDRSKRSLVTLHLQSGSGVGVEWRGTPVLPHAFLLLSSLELHSPNAPAFGVGLPTSV